MIYTSGSEFQSLRSVPVPPSAYFACLSLLTHLIQIISSLGVRSVHELCYDWHAPYTQCPLLPTPWAGEICCSLLHFGTFIQGLRCATSSSIASVHYNRLWSITELIPNRPRLHRDALYKWLISPLLCRVRKLLDLIKNIKIYFVVLTGLMCLERHEGE